MLARAERLHRQFFEVAPVSGSLPAWEAPADVFEHGSELSVCVALPGVAPEDVQVSLQDAVLYVAGVRQLRLEPRSAVIRRLEIPHGRFERRIDLPGVDYAIEARELRNGCVHLRLRRR